MKFKKTVLLIGAVALAGFGLLLAGCDEAAAHTDHVFSAWEITPATCEQDGKRVSHCTIKGCNEVREEPIPALGHDMDLGRETTPATCTEAGVRTRTCTRCGKTQTSEISPLGHEWDEGEVTAPATCTEKGSLFVTCLREGCGATDVMEIKELGHHWETQAILSEPTCTSPGLVRVKCDRDGCGKEDEMETLALGHRWVAGASNREATCTEGGVRDVTCSRCHETENRTTPALGHSWEGEYTIDVKPSFEAPGEKSYHCTRCNARDGVTVIPMLEINTPIEYEFRALRNNGDRIPSSSLVISVYDEEGNKVAESSRTTLDNGSFKATLLPKVYTVTVTGLPEGYSARESYTADPADPLCRLYLTAAPIQTPPSAGTRYAVGSIMHDFTIAETANNLDRQLKLSDLLKQKKCVVLNFWYVGCQFCVAEFPGLDAVYREFSDRAEVIAVNPYDSLAEIKQFARQYSLTFPMARDTANLSAMFGVTGYPTSVVIDSEGVVCRILVGETSESTFRTLFTQYTGGETARTAEILRNAQALLPERKQNNDD